MQTAERFHDFSYGHRVFGHENKCAHLHGHNGRVHFVVTRSKLDTVGRILDFSKIKELLCQWVEDYWDHRMLIADNDPWLKQLQELDDKVLSVPFNPTAENMAKYLVEVIGPHQLAGTGTELVFCRVEETRKCSASFYKENRPLGYRKDEFISNEIPK